jgi:hypothetical protein
MNIVLRDWSPDDIRVLCAVILGRPEGVCIARGCCCAMNLQTAVDGRWLAEAASLTAARDKDFDDILQCVGER